MDNLKDPRLPPGWDSKFEPKTGKSYFINYFTRSTTLDDPRLKHLTNQIEKVHFCDDIKSSPRQVPLMGASAMHSNTHTNTMAESLARIRAMFPTVPETHIKALLIKYHGREAVVVSALQVEKHPVATPGPFTPPPGRPAMTHRVASGSPLARRPPPKPHSPKMKLRYLKSVFPVVEETVLLDTLVSADNNVTYATERLLTMGFDKRDTPPPRVSLRKKDKETIEKEQVPKRAPPPPRTRSLEEKQSIKTRICSKHPEVAERVVSLALDSADYNEQTAETIISLMLEDKRKPQKETEDEIECSQLIREEGETKTEAVPTTPLSPVVVSPKRRLKGRNDVRESKEECLAINCSFESPFLVKAQGPNKELPQGPDDRLLLEDYVTWIGPQRGLARGPDRSLVVGPRGAKGPDLSLRKGPRKSLAKGSIYARLSLGQESRGE